MLKIKEEFQEKNYRLRLFILSTLFGTAKFFRNRKGDIIMLIKNRKRGLKALLVTALAIALIASPLQAMNLQIGAEESGGTNEIYFEDDFNRADGIINGDNGWVSEPRQFPEKSHKIENGALKTEDFNMTKTGAYNSVTKRPASEAAVNQRISTDILNLDKMANNATANLHLRVMPSTGKNGAGLIHGSDCYYLAASREAIQIRRVKSANYGTAALSDSVAYSFADGHSYRAEFSAIGIYPTLLEGRLYDLTDGGRLVARVTYSDSSRDLQAAGTVGLSCTSNGETEEMGRYYALFDNFKYEEKADILNFEDSFNRTGELGNDWIAGPMASGTLTGSALRIKTVFPDENDDNLAHVEKSAFMRPISEKSLNQIVEIEFSKGNSSGYNIGGAVIARAQSETPNYEQCYSASVETALSASGAYNFYLYIRGGKSNYLFSQQLTGLNPRLRYRLQMRVTSISETQTQIRVTLLYTEDNGATWKNKWLGGATDKTIIDDNPELQKPGTAGFSLYDEKRYDIDVYNFKYQSLPELYPAEGTYNTTELGSYITYKNLYSAGESGAAVQTGAPALMKNAEIAEYLNQKSAYVAAAFNAPESGEYTFKTDFKVISSNADELAGYYAANNEYPYAYMVANGTAYRMDYESTDGSFASSGEIKIALNAGTNIVYFMGATAELAAKLSGAAICYDRVYSEEAIEAVNVDFVVPGDLNSDSCVDIRDLVRFKRYLALEDVSIAYDSIDALITGDTDSEYTADDLAVLRLYLLDSRRFGASTWLTYKKAAELNNTFYKLTVKNRLNVAYFGGSVTQGYGSTDASAKSWRALTTAWLKEQYPAAVITETNAAIGGTGTSYGIYRAASDLKLAYTSARPDLVFIEFAINDLYDGVDFDGAKSNMETIIRTVYSYAPDADIMLLFTTDKTRSNTEYDTVRAHKEIANAYKLPYLSIGAMLWEDLLTESNSTYPSDAVWNKYFYDYVHPADAGYAKYAEYVENYLSGIFAQKTQAPKGVVNSYMPEAPLTSLTVSPYAANAKGQTGVTGFGVDENGYIVSNSPDNSISFKFTGTDLKLWVWATDKSGSIDMEIDGASVGSADLYRASPNHKIIPVASGLENTEHTFRLTPRETENGNQMYLRWFLISGSDNHNGITIVK